MTIELKIELDQLAWFKTSPDAGDPDCICSYCGFVIPEDDWPIRIFRECDNTEARLHLECFRELTS
jgi:hypothetical protein